MGRRIYIDNCEYSVEYECPLEWKNLKKTDDSQVRFCGKCSKNVYRCKTDEDMDEHIKLNHCIAVNGPEMPIGLIAAPDPFDDFSDKKRRQHD